MRNKRDFSISSVSRRSDCLFQIRLSVTSQAWNNLTRQLPELQPFHSLLLGSGWKFLSWSSQSQRPGSGGHGLIFLLASALQQLSHHMLRCHSESQSSSCCTPKSTPEEQQQEGRAAAPCRRPGGTEQLCNQNFTKLICPDLLSLRPTSCRSTKIRQGHMTTDCSTKYLERFKIKSHTTLTRSQLTVAAATQTEPSANNCYQ